MFDIISKWKNGLSKSSRAAFGRLAGMLGASEINAESWEQLESMFLQSDMGLDTTLSIINSLKKTVAKEGITQNLELDQVIRHELISRLSVPSVFYDQQIKPFVVLLVGVNGSGKTTTAAKLGSRFTKTGSSVIFGAADTFRAAAVEQLQVWGNKLGIEVISGAPESDPGAVAFSTVQAGVARDIDLIFIDTAGRLHTRINLMEELKKVFRVVGKALPGAPHAVWLVLDSTTGQNALQQAKSFQSAVNVTGVILSKLDSSSHGGMAFAIQSELGLPILFAGLGEKDEDLIPFDPEAFVSGIMG
ncbi:MAG: signal recognition particle-docking protein FtsY [Chloroflexota bacterium]